ncbi:MAG TPA: response regulator [Patescibacteria group bacterium]|nr:response regulator [Patescibacteria group bacterium]
MSQKTILVVEDEKPLLTAIQSKLKKNDFQVETAKKVEEALAKLEELERIDVIWLDHYLLGHKSGLDLIAKLKGEEQWKSIPVFVVSNTASADKVRSYINLGVDKYYTKADYRLDKIITDIIHSLEEKKDK